MKKEPVGKSNELLRRAREERGWTRETLAEKIGSSGRAVGSWERGERLTSPVFRERLCEILEKSPEQLGLMEAEEVEEEVQELKKKLPSRLDENQRKMIQRVRSRWITGVLENPLHLATLITPGLREQPDAVVNPWRLVVQESDKPPRLLPPGTRLTDVYDEYGEILVLGEPGAGKTTLLLDLTRDLLERCEGDVEQLMPVIFNLSSWAEKSSSLEEWLVEELNIRYQVPRSLGQKWIESDQMFPLLDGLDEVKELARTTCVEEINNYRQRHGMVSLVICSRSDDYFDQSARLVLHTAVIVQPLTIEQIDAYLSEAGDGLAIVRATLQHDQILREMASTPLMLSTLAFTYRGQSLDAVLTEDDPSKRRRTVLKNYVERVLEHRGSRKKGYDFQRTVHHLAWLATQMADRNQTEFYIERLQPDWLSAQSDHYQNTIIRMVYGLLSALIGALYAWLFGGKPELGNNRGVGNGLLGWLGSGPGNHVLGWMAPGLGGGLEGGGMLGLILGFVTVLATIVIDTEELTKWTPALIRLSLLRGLFFGLRNGLISFIVMAIFCGFLFWGSGHDIQYALGFGTYTGLFIGLVSAMVSGLTANRNQKPHNRVGLGTTTGNGIIIGLCGGISFGIVETLLVNIEQGVTYAVIITLAYSAIFGFGGGTSVIRGVGREIKPAEIVGWNWQAVKRSLLSIVLEGLVIGFFILVIVMIVIGFAGSLFYSPVYGWRYGLVYGVIVGLVAGVACLLTGILNSGWRSETLNERQLLRPNEGTRRSVKNGLFAGSLFGVLGGITSGVIVGLSFWLVGGLSGWIILGTGFAIVLGAVFAFDFAMIRGGIAALEHYTLRWYLWRRGYLPWNAIQFLDYASERILLRKVGGGYIFMHRLLLEYFANLDRSDAPYP